LTNRFTFAPLNSAHDRKNFSCGVPALDRYIPELASQDIRRRISNCFVAASEAGQFAGYYTLAATSLPLGELAPEHARKLPRYTAFPACLIGRLAVDQGFHGQGLGSALLVDAIARSPRSEPAIFVMIVDAKEEAAARFYSHHGFRSFSSRPLTFYLPVAEAAHRLRKL
jgi:ribosomal protein S18 acetylase RimI-like enzyme